MQESDLINELDQLASAPSASTTTAFSDDPQHETSVDVGSGMTQPKTAAAAASAAGSASSGGVESLKMLDSDDGADMEIFNDDEGDEYAAGGGKGSARKENTSSFGADESPISWSGTGKKKVVSAALRNEIKELLSTPLTIPALIKKGRDRDRERGDSDDDDDDDHDDKSTESGEDYTDDEDEGESGYKVGGYHRVKVGDIFNQGYVFCAVECGFRNCLLRNDCDWIPSMVFETGCLIRLFDWKDRPSRIWIDSS